VKRVAIVFGTRPEAIKLAPVIARFRERDDVDCRVYVTGQHRQMLDQVLEAFAIRPDIDLNLMRPDQPLNALVSRVVAGLDAVFVAEVPNLLLVQGDTTTTFCAALAAFHRRIPVGHVEAGLRSGDLSAPWPEEANRVLTTRLATLHFAPTCRNRDALLAEGIPASCVTVTGNTVVDAVQMARDRVAKAPPMVAGLDLTGERVVLVTGHRRESFGAGFDAICEAIATLARRFPDVLYVYPVHLNPMVREPVFRLLGSLENVRLIEPLSYLPFVHLMIQSTLILTDSGGIQEEAPTLGKPVLIMREISERPEAVEAGAARLVGTSSERIVEETTRLLTDAAELERMSHVANPFGDGAAAQRIVSRSLAFFAEEPARIRLRPDLRCSPQSP
jgi:UDP-N-acetylglucosamine 2-epimerase (non-hydrolysing)